MSEWWSQRGTGARFVIAFGGALLMLNIAASVAGSILGGDPTGSTSSSYATTADGLSAWATVLREEGFEVAGVRDALDDAPLDPSETLVIADPAELESGERDAVAGFVRAGGRLVVAGGAGSPLAESLIDGLRWSPGGPVRAVAIGEPIDVGGARTVVASGAGSWSDVGDGTPLLEGDDDVLLVAAEVGAGRVLALADTAPVANALLGEADNAALALAIVGEGRPVRFAEATHGYGGGGIDLPRGWAGAIVGFALAAIVWMWSRGRRFGPPVVEDDVPPPPRRAYIDALAATVARAGSPAEAAAPLRARARAHLARRAGVDSSAADAELRNAAQRAGVQTEIVERVLAVPGGAGSLLDLGQAAAQLEDDR